MLPVVVLAVRLDVLMKPLPWLMAPLAYRFSVFGKRERLPNRPIVPPVAAWPAPAPKVLVPSQLAIRVKSPPAVSAVVSGTVMLPVA